MLFLRYLSTWVERSSVRSGGSFVLARCSGRIDVQRLGRCSAVSHVDTKLAYFRHSPGVEICPSSPRSLPLVHVADQEFPEPRENSVGIEHWHLSQRQRRKMFRIHSHDVLNKVRRGLLTYCTRYAGDVQMAFACGEHDGAANSSERG